ncbi:multiple coagulation factor deficiency protein 2 homolog [Melanaphis sacchari]|uniref:multiple coagulation factor deficiency protein 2 homolog n=1 Tax=Melanaphis sacchari TaxID=742174 RepID=UPI000DC142DB|nr:multiple coagulation factor deficiency protein 2 homolog [Melanaphis sacchari]
MRGPVLAELLLVGIAVGFQRGPHHPRAAVSGELRIESNHHREHKHPKPMGDTKFTQDKPILHDKRHIEEDLGLPDIDDSNLTDEELEFRYFIAHDYDKNTMLDGLELMSAFAHNMENYGDTETKISNLENYTDLVDQILYDDDTNYDGFLSYTEYVIAKNKHLQNI